MTAAKKPECWTCDSGAMFPSLWASADNRAKWRASLCPEHAAVWQKADDDWAAIGKAMDEINADPVKKAAFDAKLKISMAKREKERRRYPSGRPRKRGGCDCCHCRRY